ncbi:MAG: glutamine synthetase family protein [Litorimonas sp.]
MTDLTSPQDANRVRVLFCDQLGLGRGKYLPRKFADKGEARFCAGAYAVTYAKDLIDAPGAGFTAGLPDVEAFFDPDNYKQGWEPSTAIALANLEESGEPFGLCGRTSLKNAIARWTDKGLKPMIGIETEAYIFERDSDGKWVPYNTPGAFVYGTGPFTDPAGLMDIIWETAEKCGLPLESMNSEYDAPQFELTMCFDEAMKACDDIFLFKLMAREILFKRGYLLCFMPKPILELSGTGLHLNFSLQNKDGKNIFARETETGPLPEIMAACTAGLIKHHEALGGLLAPTVNSYDRLKPGSMSGYWANWGYDHRGVAVRISGETGSGSRIEHRLGDCAVSPYLAVSALLNAAYLGLEKGYDLPPAETGDGLTKVDATRSIADNLGGALDYLVADTDLTAAIGQLLIDNYVTIKRCEIKELEGKSHAEIFDYYAPYI